ncbi:MAG: hypothetical protein ACTSP3_11485 [Candidatus Heimdallarchaeaceae archaeon]
MEELKVLKNPLIFVLKRNFRLWGDYHSAYSKLKLKAKPSSYYGIHRLENLIKFEQ